MRREKKTKKVKREKRSKSENTPSRERETSKERKKWFYLDHIIFISTSKMFQKSQILYIFACVLNALIFYLFNILSLKSTQNQTKCNVCRNRRKEMAKKKNM